MTTWTWTLRLRGSMGFGVGFWRADYGTAYLYTLALGPVCIYWARTHERSRKVREMGAA